jgi:Ca2+-binding RTX toxin-like protein
VNRQWVGRSRRGARAGSCRLGRPGRRPANIFPPDANPDDDYIDGQDDGDVVAPGAGNDHVWGSDGSDYLYGQLGDDTIFGGDHQDWMDCAEGVDYADGGRGSNGWVSTTHGCETLISAAP